MVVLKNNFHQFCWGVGPWNFSHVILKVKSSEILNFKLYGIMVMGDVLMLSKDLVGVPLDIKVL